MCPSIDIINLGGLLYNERVPPLHPDFINPDTPSHQVRTEKFVETQQVKPMLKTG